MTRPKYRELLRKAEELDAEVEALRSALEQVPPKQFEVRLAIANNLLKKMVAANENGIAILETFCPSAAKLLRDQLEGRKKQCVELLNEQKSGDLNVVDGRARGVIEGLSFEKTSMDFAFLAAKESAGRIEDPTKLFNSLNLHKGIHEASFPLFADEHYGPAIFEAYKAMNNHVKVKAGRKDLDGQDLMSAVFSVTNPILRLNELESKSDKDEQMGFMFLFMGAMTGIRNPKAHDIVEQRDPTRTLEYLALASLLMRRIDEATKIDQIKAETTKNKSAQAPIKSITAPKELVLSKEQLAYRARLKEELIALRILLDNVTNPFEIPFPVWLCDGDFSMRRRLIANGEEHDLIQKFYTALQNRYNYQKTMVQPDSKFAVLNTDCIRAYDKITYDVIFVVEGAHVREELQTYAQLGEILLRIIGGSPRPGGNLSISATDFEKIGEIIEERRYLVPDSISEAWRNAKTATIAHTGESVMDLQLLVAFQANVNYHRDFLRKQIPQ